MTITRVLHLFLIVCFVTSIPAMTQAQGELRRMSITQVAQPTAGIPVFTDHPDKAAVIIESSLSNLVFTSNLEGIVDQRSEPERGRYILIIEPFTQIIQTNAPGFISGRFRIAAPQARDVLYYEIGPEERLPDLVPLIINVEPADARLFVDGQVVEANRTIQLPPGPKQIRLERVGYRLLEDVITVSMDNVQFNYRMEEIDLVPVRITSNLPGARVNIDGVGQGVTDSNGGLTFFRFPGLYELSVSLDGYVRQRRSVEIVETGDNSFSITLQRNVGTLLVDVSPADARVRVGNRVVPPGEFVELEPGPYRLEVQNDGYDAYEEEITITLDEQVLRDVTLERNTGSLTLNVTPRDARVEVNRREYEPAVAINLSPGLYRLEVFRNGYDSHVAEISIERNEDLVRQITLERQTGGLRFNVMPTYAKATLIADDGRVWDEWEGIRIVRELPVGEYRMAVTASGYQSKEERIVIKKDETFEMEVSLEEGSSWEKDAKAVIVEVTSATGRVWMDRNLGASRAATSSTDSEAYGDLYQWGRAADGHQKRNSPTTSTLSSSDLPVHGSFILAPDSPYDWHSSQNDILWQGVSGANNPCPSGYRLPTEAEWNAERNSWESDNASGAFASPLKLPMAGSRGFTSGSLFLVGSYGRYWSSTLSGSFAQDLDFISGNAGMVSNGRALGLSVRCIKD